MKTAKIGLLGFGNVGGGTYKILTDNKQIIEKRTGISPEIVKILQRNKKKKRFASADPALLTEDPDDIIKNPEIDIVVEMLGGIEPAPIRRPSLPITVFSQKLPEKAESDSFLKPA